MIEYTTMDNPRGLSIWITTPENERIKLCLVPYENPDISAIRDALDQLVIYYPDDVEAQR